MLGFTKEIRLAINLINKLSDKPTNASNLAELFGVSKSSVLNLTHKLSKAGLIITSRGVNGGIVAGNSANLYDLYQALYHDDTGKLNGVTAAVHHEMVEALKNISIKTEIYPEFKNITFKDEMNEESLQIIAETKNEIDKSKDEIDEVIDSVSDGFNW